MRTRSAALIIMGLLSSPALSQAPGGAGATAPSESASQALWCGAAFQILASSVAGTAAEDYEALAQIAFGKAARELIPGGMTVEQFRGLAEDAARAVTAPFREQSYTETECRAAVADAQ